MPRGKGRRSGGRKVPRKVRGAIRASNKSSFRGFTPRGRSDPPRVILTPWNSITLSTLIVNGETAANKCLNIIDLAKLFYVQTGIPEDTPIMFKILNMQLWHISPQDEISNRLRARFYSLLVINTTCSDSEVLSQQEDYGTPARNATIKYIWPRVHSDNIFVYSAIKIFTRLTLDINQQVLGHIRILWRSYGVASTVFDVANNTCTQSKMSALLNSDENTDKMVSSLSKLEL